MKLLSSITSWSFRRCAKFESVTLVVLLSAGAVVAKDSAVPSPKSTNAPAPAAELVIPLSVFNAGPQVGRNPFFQRSARDVSKSSEAMPVSRFPEGVRLGGISGFPARPLAIINDVTFAPGEIGEIKIDGRRVTVRVDSIKEHSVIMTIGGITEQKSLRKAF